MPFQGKTSNSHIVMGNVTRDRTWTIRKDEGSIRAHERTRRLATKECVLSLFSSIFERPSGISYNALTQSPLKDRQFSPPTHRSPDPESSKSTKSRAGVPIWSVTVYPPTLSFGLTELMVEKKMHVVTSRRRVNRRACWTRLYRYHL